MSRPVWEPLVEVSGHARDELARFMADSRRLATSQQETMDQRMFRMSAQEARITSPALDFVEGLAAALETSGPVRLDAGSLSRFDKCQVSLLLEKSALRAGRWGGDTPPAVSSAVSALALDWDRSAGVPADRRQRELVLIEPGRRRAAALAKKERDRLEATRQRRSIDGERYELAMDRVSGPGAF